MATINIFNSVINLPDVTPETEIENWGTEIPSEQYWRRTDLPDYFSEVEFDKEGNLLLNKAQELYAKKEVERCKKGFFFLNNGVVTYITGNHYFYLKWWRLEDDIYPDFRNVDRQYFLFLNHWKSVLWCLGIVRGKMRRLGASSQATCNLIYECIFFKNSSNSPYERRPRS